MLEALGITDGMCVPPKPAKRLFRLGYTPMLAAADGLPGHAPFDRIIATCALFAVPAAWIDQLRPDGLALVHIEGPLGAGNLLALRRSDNQEMQGRVPALVGDASCADAPPSIPRSAHPARPTPPSNRPRGTPRLTQPNSTAVSSSRCSPSSTSHQASSAALPTWILIC
jgi:hypothetical protein